MICVFAILSHPSLTNRILHSSPLPPSLWHCWTYFVFCVTNCNDESTEGLLVYPPACSPPNDICFGKIYLRFYGGWSLHMITFRAGNLSRMCFVLCLFGLEIPRNYPAHTHTRLTTLHPLWSKYPPWPEFSPQPVLLRNYQGLGRKMLKMQQPRPSQVIIVNWFSASLRKRDDKRC